MWLIKKFIRNTERETLSYKILQKLYYQIGKLLNLPNYISCLWTPERFVSTLHDFLQKHRDGDIEIVAHDIVKNFIFLQKLFENHGYTFLNNEAYNEKTNNSVPPLFSRKSHDTRKIKQYFSVQNKIQETSLNPSLYEIAKLLNITTFENRIFSSSADCFLCACCFIGHKKLKILSEYFRKKDMAAKSFDYELFVENTNFDFEKSIIDNKIEQ